MDLRFIPVLIKDVKLLLRDPMAFGTLLVMPIIFIVILSFALGPAFNVAELKITVPTLDQDGSDASRHLVELLRQAGGLDIKEVPADRLDAERDRVRKGKDVAALVIPAGFGAALDGGQTAELRVLMDPADTTGGEIVRGVVMGTSQQLAAEGRALQLVQTLVERLPNTAGVDKQALQDDIQAEVAQQVESGGGEGISVAKEVAGLEARDTPDVYEQNVPGYTVLAVFFLVTSLSTSILAERRDGTFRRLLATPIRRSYILLGKLLAYTIVGFAQVALLFAFGHFVFGMRLGDQPLGLVIVTAALVPAATGLGIFVATLATSEQQAGGLSTLSVLALAALGGSMVPRFVMPEAMQKIGLVTPHAWAIDGYQDVIVRGAGIADVLPQAGVLLAFAVVFFALGVLRFRFD